MKRYVIGVDSSTQSTKAIAWDLQGHVVAQGKAPLSVASPAPGWAEQDPRAWWDSTRSALRQVLAEIEAAEIVAVGLAWQRETFIALDAAGEPLRPAILWLDQRATREVAQLCADFGADRFHRITGKQLDTTPSLVKLVWMRRHEPDRYRRLAFVLDVGAYLARSLTGRTCTCLAGADSLGLLDMESGFWSTELLDHLGLDDWNLPELVLPASQLGVVSAEASRATGLRAGTPVIAAGGDGQVFAVGVNACGPDTLSLTAGTSLVLGVHWPAYRIGSPYRTMVGCYPGTFLLEAVLRAGADIIRWFVRDFAPGRSESQLEAEIACIAPGCRGLLTLPYWKGRMVPTNEPLARGVTIGWSDYHTEAHFYRSLLEGIAFEVRFLIEGYERDLEIAPCTLHLGGGGALSAVWRQIMADVTGREVVLSAVESTALGAAMMAATAIGAYSSLYDAAAAMYHSAERICPRAAERGIYDKLYTEFYRDLYPIFAPLLAELGRHALEKEEHQ